MHSFAIYGKGGSGKSTVAANLSVQFARKQLRTLQIGCDPKHDSTRSLTAGRRIPTVVDLLRQGLDKPGAQLERQAFLTQGVEGIGCIETGGPESGTGCAGLGIVSAFRLLKRQRVFDDYDAVVMDVLGDVVCGGFAMPLTKGLAGSVAIVVSDTLMSMYAANNVAKAIVRYRRNGIALAGLIANGLRDPAKLGEVEAFAERLGTRVLVAIEHDERIAEAERQAVPVSLLDTGGELDAAFGGLADALLALEPDTRAAPAPMDDDAWEGFMREIVG
jgi:nitrogenase iron protein NifH